jgi:hypothetical protein
MVERLKNIHSVSREFEVGPSCAIGSQTARKRESDVQQLRVGNRDQNVEVCESCPLQRLNEYQGDH